MKKLSTYQPDNWGLVLSGFASGYGVGLVSLLALPFLITGVMNDLGLNEAQAGFLMSAEFSFTMISSLLIAPVMGRIPRRTFAMIGALVAILANIASAQVGDVYTLFVVRSVAGFGAGLALACGNACVASARDPGRTASYMNILFVALMIVIMLSYSKTLSLFGLSGLYYATALTMAAMLLLIRFMPQQALAHEQVVAKDENRTKLFSWVAFCMMMTMFLFSVRDTMGWAFVGQVGLKVGYTDTQLGTLFSAQTMVGLIGPVLAGVIGIRFGLSLPILLGIMGTGLVSLGYILGGESMTIYTVSVMLIVTTYFYTLVYLTELAARLDKEGRIIAASSSFLTLGIAVGPAITGWLVTLGGYRLAGMMIAVLILLTVAAVIVPLRKIKALEATEKPVVVMKQT